MATPKEKREKIMSFLVKLYDYLDPTKTNSNNLRAKLGKMSDEQFIQYFRKLCDDPKKHLYFEIAAFEKDREPTFEQAERAAFDIVGDEYCHLYDYIAYPDLSDDPNNPVVSVNKIFNGYINLRRVQQIVNHKTHIPTGNEKRDPKTGQVTQESKAARISDAEQYAMISQGTNNILKEMFGPRGGDPVMRTEMEKQIAASGSSVFSEMTDSRLNKTSLNTANVYFLASALETDLVTKRGVLPRTIKNQYDEARSINRTGV